MKALPPRLDTAAIPAPVRDVLARLGDGGFEAFLVGGCIRDLLLGKTPKDFDITTRALPAEVQKLFRKVIPTGIEHGTVTVLAQGHPVEVTTYRSESEYLDGRRPSRVEFRTHVADDLARRDFTINAMAFNPLTRAFEDPFEGQKDLDLRRVRCVGSALERFGEDGLRPLRAVRIATVLDFQLEPETEAAIPATLAVFRKVAAERVHDELVKLLLASGVARGLELLRSVGLMGEFLPELAARPDLAERAAWVSRTPPDEVLRLAVLLGGVPHVREILTRLKFPNKVIDLAVLLGQQPLPLQETAPTDADLRRWMSSVGRENIERGLGVAAAKGEPGVEPTTARVHALAALQPPLLTKELALDGKALMAALQIPPSPQVGEVTRYLLQQVFEEPSLNTPEALTRLARAWLEQGPRKP